MVFPLSDLFDYTSIYNGKAVTDKIIIVRTAVLGTCIE